MDVHQFTVKFLASHPLPKRTNLFQTFPHLLRLLTERLIPRQKVAVLGNVHLVETARFFCADRIKEVQRSRLHFFNRTSFVRVRRIAFLARAPNGLECLPWSPNAGTAFKPPHRINCIQLHPLQIGTIGIETGCKIGILRRHLGLDMFRQLMTDIP